jgi:hypothetical protein
MPAVFSFRIDGIPRPWLERAPNWMGANPAQKTSIPAVPPPNPYSLTSPKQNINIYFITFPGISWHTIAHCGQRFLPLDKRQCYGLVAIRPGDSQSPDSRSAGPFQHLDHIAKICERLAPVPAANFDDGHSPIFCSPSG